MNRTVRRLVVRAIGQVSACQVVPWAVGTQIGV